MKFLLLFFFSIAHFIGKTQDLQGQLLNGQHQPVSAATIRIYPAANYKPLWNLQTDSMGYFFFSPPASDSLTIEISHLHYQPYRETFAWKELPNPWQIELKEEAEGIAEVQVTGAVPRIVRKIDRLVFQVENSNLSGLSGWEILKRTPQIQVQGSTLSVRGSQNVLVLINERRQLMSMEELQNLLESTPGSEISSIEVITNPPAKYEASGTAVINIIMKKDRSQGYKGSLYGKYEQSNFAKQLLGITQNYKTEKLNLRGTYYFGRGTYARYGEDVVFYPKEQQLWRSKMDRIDESNNQQTYSLNAEYAPDSTLNWSIGWNGSYQPNSNGIYQVPTFIEDNQGKVVSQYHTQNDHKRYSASQNLYVEVAKKINPNNQLSWSNYYSHSERNQFQDIQTLLAFQHQPKDSSRFITDSHYNTRLLASQLDGTSKIKALNLDYGAKYSYVNSQNKMLFQDDESGKLEQRPEKSSDFNYKEQNAALYLSGSYAYKKWQWKAGIRGEYTNLEGLVSNPEDLNKTDYLTWFPTFYMQYETDKQAQWGFSYGKRINRPSYSWLNPAKSYYNQFSYFQGDPRLRASISHNLNLSLNHKNWVIDLFYIYEKWPNMEISFQNNETNELVYHYTNIKNGQSAGVSISKNLNLNNFWSIYADVTGMYNDNIFQGMDKLAHKNEVFSFNGLARSTWIVDKKSDWNMELSYRYYSPSIQGTFDISQFAYLDFSMTRKFWNKNLEAGLYVLDMLKTSGNKVSTKYGDQDNYFIDYQDSRKLMLTLRYNFGNQSVKNTKAIQRTEEQDRL